jgi:hypothetical protein
MVILRVFILCSKVLVQHVCTASICRFIFQFRIMLSSWVEEKYQLCRKVEGIVTNLSHRTRKEGRIVLSHWVGRVPRIAQFSANSRCAGALICVGISILVT